MENLRTTFFSILAGLALVGTSVWMTHSFATEQHEGFTKTSRGFGPHRIFRLLDKLDVSRDQRRAIGEVMDRYRPEMRELMFDLKDGKKALRDILVDENYDPSQIETLAAAQAKNAGQLFVSTAAAFAEVGTILTPEQRAELAQMMDRPHRHWRRHGKHDRDDSETSPRDTSL